MVNIYNQNNPRLQAATLICVAQMSDIGKFEKIHNLVTFIYNGLTSPNSFVKYYALYALATYS